jgi:thiol-disulfide isomerase/thioredoxin
MSYGKFSDYNKLAMAEQSTDGTMAEQSMAEQSTDGTCNITLPEFKKSFLKDYDVIVIDSWAKWCTPCKKILPHYEKQAHKLRRNPCILFTKDDIDKEDSFCAPNCTSIPTFFIYVKGKLHTKTNNMNDVIDITNQMNEITTKYYQSK